MYEAGHAFGIKYLRDNMPSSDVLIGDLMEMLTLYRRALYLGGTDELDVDDHLDSGEELQAKLEERRKQRYHRVIERNQKLANDAKRYHGYRCQVCGFDFEERYGELGKGYIEAHHLQPLSSYSDDEPVLLSAQDDFAVVCANCHRMLHRKDAPETFDEFVALFQKTRPTASKRRKH